LIGEGKADEALKLVQQALRDRPDSAEAHFTAARALLALRRIDEAEAELHRAVEREPNLPDAYLLLGGLSLEVHHDAAGAEDNFRKALEYRANDATAHYHVARCRLLQNDKDGATKEFAEAVRYRPGYAAAHLALGELDLEAGRIDDAITHLEAAAKLEPNNDKARDLLAQAKAKKKS
jgi:tetratricopeptide (TPR) repeat protein